MMSIPIFNGGPIPLICFFTFTIHLTESLAYSMRLAGVRTRQIAIAMSFVTSTLLVSRLSNMFQAPFLGSMVDHAILYGGPSGVLALEHAFRFIIFSAFLGSFVGALLTPTALRVFQVLIQRFLVLGSMPRLFLSVLNPSNLVALGRAFRLPRWRDFSTVNWRSIPKGFLIFNMLVTSIYCIGVLCSLLAGAYLPEFRATAIQLSGIVNGMATILFTIFVDPPGARITDQAVNGERSEGDVKAVVFLLQLGKMIGTLIIAQILFKPLTLYILFVAKWISHGVSG